MAARCSFCNTLITAKNRGKFFPEDDSHICEMCLREHQKSLEETKNRSYRKATAGRLAFAVSSANG